MTEFLSCPHTLINASLVLLLPLPLTPFSYPSKSRSPTFKTCLIDHCFCSAPLVSLALTSLRTIFDPVYLLSPEAPPTLFFSRCFHSPTLQSKLQLLHHTLLSTKTLRASTITCLSLRTKIKQNKTKQNNPKKQYLDCEYSTWVPLSLVYVPSLFCPFTGKRNILILNSTDRSRPWRYR
jgi:hypothetical protein